MSTTRRDKPYIWVTWLTALLSGEKHCEFALWYRAQFQYEKKPDTKFNSTAWAADHDAAVEVKRDEMRAAGWLVMIEDQNKFFLPGRNANLGGKPDLIGRKLGISIIPDVKTGRQRKSDWWQVLVYIWVFKRLRADPKAKKWHTLGPTINGEVVYPPSEKEQRRETVTIAVMQDELTPDREERIVKLLRMAGDGTKRPEQVPSFSDCRYCDVADCVKRHVETPEEQTIQEDF